MRRMRAAWLLTLVACGSAPPPQPAKPAPVPVAAPVADAGEQLVMPHGYVEIVVADVVDLDGNGGAVLVLDETTNLVVPIFIGGTEAASIKARLAGTPRERPLTHDLLDSIVRKLDAAIVKVQIDELRDQVYIGSVFVRPRGGRIARIDARPSDAIALAIGNKIPMYVAKAVFEASGVPRDQVRSRLYEP